MCRLHKVRDVCLHTNTHSERLAVSVMNWFSLQLIGCFVQAICVYVQVRGGAHGRALAAVSYTDRLAAQVDGQRLIVTAA